MSIFGLNTTWSVVSLIAIIISIVLFVASIVLLILSRLREDGDCNSFARLFGLIGIAVLIVGLLIIMLAPRRCEKCGEKRDQFEPYCPNCRYSTKISCSNCGYEMETTDKYCSRCGNPADADGAE